MDVLKLIEETQKKLFNNSAIVQYDDSSYIYPHSVLNNQEFTSNSLNRYYKGYIKNKMFNIYDDDLRIFDMIEHMNNKKTLERLRKAKEIQREKLREEIFNEDESKKTTNFVIQNNINLSNFEEKLRDKQFSSEHGSNIMYMLMKFLLNRRKFVKRRKINEKISNLHSKKDRDFYKDKLNKLINNSSIYSQSIKSNNSSNNINKKFMSSLNSQMNSIKKESMNRTNEIKKSKSYLNFKSLSKDNSSEISIINDKLKTDYIKKFKMNQYEDAILNDNNELNDSINKENTNSVDIHNLEEKKKTKEEELFKQRLTKKRLNSIDAISINFPLKRKEIFKKFNYINEKKLENMRKANKNKNIDFSSFNINQRKDYISQFDLQKHKSQILSNLNNINDKAKEINNQINNSYRNDNNKNMQEEKKTMEKSVFSTTNKYNEKTTTNLKIEKDEKENMSKYNEKHIAYTNKSNYLLAQTNLHFFGKNKIIDAIDNFKQNLSSELKKQIIKQNGNLLRINMKQIIKKFNPRHKFE